MSDEQAIDKKPESKVLATINSKGLFEFNNQEELAVAANLLIKIKQAPDHLSKEGPRAVASAILLCKQYGLPQKAMNQMAFIKGKLSCYGSLVTALAERHPLYGEKREFFVDENIEEICVRNKNLKAPVYAAVIQIRKKGHENWVEYFFTREDAETAGLIGKGEAWNKYFKDMLMHKCRKRALSAEYSSALEGIEYHEDLVESVRDVTTTAIEQVKEDFNTVEGEYTVGVEL